MPLLHIVGMTSSNKTFSACFCFLSSETESNYSWALANIKRVFEANCLPVVIVTDRELALMSAIRKQFPEARNLLCAWHINKNILTHLRKQFATMELWTSFMDDWNQLVHSMNEAEFTDNLKKLRLTHTAIVVDYLEKTWLIYKERFVLAWTKEILHLNNLVTSRVEGKHAVLKSWISTSAGDLKDVCKNIFLSVENQEHEIRRQIAHDCMKTLIKQQHPFWAQAS
jgi:hypothetical protein